VVAFATGCGGEGGDGGNQAVDVKFTRTDGSLAPFPRAVRAWCGPYDEDNRDIEAVNVLAGEAPRDGSPDAYWIVTAVRGDVERDPVTTFPNSFVLSEPRGAGLFAYDGDDRGNELSSADEESKGTMRIELEGCDPGDTVRVEFEDVTLGSEYSDLPPISVEGAVTAEIGDAPDLS
jgi:hypothetical protein